MSRFPSERRAALVVHGSIYALLLTMACRFLEWETALAGSFAVLVSGGLVSTLGQAWLSRSASRTWAWGGMLAALIAAWALILVVPAAGPSSTEWAFILGASCLAGLAFRGLRRSIHSGSPGTPAWVEDLRLLVLPVLAVWLYRPFLDSHFFGGVDARSYGYTMVDVLRQVHAGFFPVFVGQTEYMFNGTIHPIRTAPYHHYLGIGLDLLTFRALTPLAVQHLTVVVTAIQAALTCYLVFVSLAPASRWLAWLLAAIYLSAPAMAAYIYGQEMYMTFMAFAYLPLVFYGNVRLIQRDQFTGWIGLTTGLALVWVCHPPVAAWLSVATLAIQGLRLALWDFSPGSWLRAAGGLLLMGGLTTYYFWSMAEIAMMGEDSGFNWPLPEMGLGLGLFSLVRGLVSGRWIWLGVGAMATLILARSHAFYGEWLGVVGILVVLLLGAGKCWPAWRWRERLPEVTVLILLAAGLLGLPWLPKTTDIPAWEWMNRVFPKNLLPVSASAQGLADVQLGYALWGAILAGMIASIWAPSRENRLIGLAGALGVALVLPVPGLSRLLLVHTPASLNAISGVNAWMRFVPTMLGLAVFGGFLGAVSLGLRYPRSQRVIAGAALVALGWSLVEAEKFVRVGYRNVNTEETVRAFYRPETVRQFAYIFEKMPVSPYLTNGVVDYHLESRLLRLEDPAQEVAAAIDWSAATEVTITTRVDETAPHWQILDPSLTLSPGERVLLRFAFLDKSYVGTLVFRGPNGFYREYPMPSAGFYAKSFGVAPERPKLIALWNTSTQPQRIEAFFLCAVPPADGQPFGDFAQVAILTYDPARLPIHTRDLMPYRATVRSKEPAFLETPRAYIPGYRATVNGADRTVEASPNGMAMIRVPEGESTVELRYAGTPALRIALKVSLVTWAGVLLYLGVRWRRK